MAESGGSLASILVTIGADCTEFLDQLKQSSDAMTAFAEGGAAMAAAGVAILGSITAATEQVGSFGNQIELASQRLNISTETLSAMKMAADATGGSIDSATAAIRKLTTDAEGAATGNQKMVDLFKSLGVSVFDATGNVKDMNTLFPQVAQAISQVQNPTQQSADAIALLGRGALTLLPLLKQGSDGLDAWGQKATETGQMVSDAQGQQAHAFEMAQEEAEKALSGISMAVGQVFLPAMTDMATSIEAHLVKVREWVAAYPDVTEAVAGLGVVLGAGGVLALGIAGLGAAIPLVATGLGAVAEGVQAVGTAIGVTEATVETLTAGFLAAAAGTAALGAAIGIGVGALTDWAIKGTPVEAWLDSVTGKIQSQIMYQHDMLTTTQAAADELQNHYGVALQQGSMTIEQWNQAVTDALRAQVALDPVLQQQISSVQALSAAHTANTAVMNQERDAVLKSLQDQEAAYAATNTAQDKYNKGVQAIVDSVTGETLKNQQLVGGLGKLYSAHVDESVIIDKLGKQAQAYNDTLVAQGKTIPDVITKVLAAKDAQDLWNSVYSAWTGIYQRQAQYVDKLNTQMELVVSNLGAAAESQDQFNHSMQVAVDEIVGYDGGILPLTSHLGNLEIAHNAVNAAIKQGTADLKESEKQWEAYFTAAQAGAKLMEKSMTTAMADITKGLANDLATDLVQWKNFGDSMIKLGQDTAQKMLSALLTGLFTPLTNALTQAGKQFADWASGAISSVSSVASAAAGGAGGAAGGIGSALSGAGGGSGLLGLIGGLGGGLISGGLSLLGDMSMEGVLKAIEYNTRATYINVAISIDQMFRPMLGALEALVPNNAASISYNPGGVSAVPGASSSSTDALLQQILQVLQGATTTNLTLNLGANTLAKAMYKASRFGGNQIIGVQ
jgi:TP901 family phage tail tape measure protein